MIGRTLSHYQILDKLGAGGMGEVYLAEDTELRRRVALKVLPEELACDPDRLERFRREATSVAQLNHRNVVTIYSVEEADGVHFLTMELVEGERLGELIPTGGLPLARLFDFAIALGDAVSSAHQKGITHRDLNPDNVMVTEEGDLKVLDFGLAKKTDLPLGEADATQLATATITQEGKILGTVPYMSPEQAAGKPVDHRSDIFSLGVLLYEMATGERPFAGESSADIVSSILRDTPISVDELRRELPHHLGRIIRHCLEKDLEKRYQSAKDVRNDLADLEKELESGKTMPPRAAPSRRSRLTGRRWMLATVIVVAASAVWIMGRKLVSVRQPAGSTGGPASLHKLTFGRGLEDEPAWSPDGRFLAYTTDEEGNLDIRVLAAGADRPIRVTEHPADDAQPSWSPDGKTLAFVSARDRGGGLSIMLGIGGLTPHLIGNGGDIFLMPALGGNAIKLVEDGYYPAWSPDGQWIAFQANRDGHWDIWTVSSKGGEPVRLTDDLSFDYHPVWSPDGRWVLYGSSDRPGFGVTVANLHAMPTEGGPPVQITEDEAFVLRPCWSGDGQTVFFTSTRGSSANIWKVRFLPLARKKPEPEPVTFGEGDDVSVAVSSDQRRIAFATTQNTSDIWELEVQAGALRQVTFETTSENFPHLGPDGVTLLLSSDRGGAPAIWTFGLDGKVISRVAPSLSNLLGPRWSPDGSRVAYAEQRGERTVVVIRELGMLSVQEIREDSRHPDWSPDGTKIAFIAWEAGGEIWAYSLESGEALPLVSMRGQPGYPTWSPDGSVIAFQLQEGGGRKIWSVGTEGGTPTQLTFGDGEDSHPDWSPVDADQIVFLRDHKNLYLLDNSSGGVTPTTTYRQANIQLDYPSWSPDGTKIYFSVSKKTGDLYIIGEEF